MNATLIHFNLNSIQLHSISTPFNSISCVQCSCALWNSLTVCRTLIVPTRVNSILLNSIQFHRPQRTTMSTSVPLNQSPDISDPLYDQPADLPLSLSIYLSIHLPITHTCSAHTRRVRHTTIVVLTTKQQRQNGTTKAHLHLFVFRLLVATSSGMT